MEENNNQELREKLTNILLKTEQRIKKIISVITSTIQAMISPPLLIMYLLIFAVITLTSLNLSFGTISFNIGCDNVKADCLPKKGAGNGYGRIKNSNTTAGNKNQIGIVGHPFNEEYIVSQGYGRTAFATGPNSPYADKFHNGIDLITTKSSSGRDVPLFSITDGKVYSVAFDAGFGNFVVIQDKSGGYITYAHLKYKSELTEGKEIKSGEQIGVLGTTGTSTGDHLHLQYNSEPMGGPNIDPSFLLGFEPTIEENKVIKP